MRQYVELIEEIDRSVNGRHVLAAMWAEISEAEFTDQQVMEIISSLTQESFESFIQHYKETLRAQSRANRRSWQRLADKWAKQHGL